MSLARIFTASARPLLQKTVQKSLGKACGVSANRLLSTLKEKGKGDEEAYFKKLDEAKKVELRAKFEKILSEDDKSEDKQEILEILAHSDKPAESSLLSKYGLDDWKIAFPLGLFVAIPVVSNEILIINEETQLLACFMLFCATLYNGAAPAASKYFDEIREKDMKLFQAADELLLKDLNEAIKANEKCLGIETTVSEIFTLTDNLSVAQADLLNSIEQHKLRDLVAKKLNTLVTLEEAATDAIRTRMVTKIRSDVVSSFTNDKKAKEAALAQAIAVLAGGPDGKLGKDIVGEAFKTSIASYRTEYSKLAPGADPILQQLEKDVAEVVKLPEFDLDAGNVYVTHPVPSLAK